MSLTSFAVFLGIMFVLIAIGVPIAYSIGLGAIGMMIAGGLSNVPLTIIAQRMYEGVDSFPLLAVPLFMIAGNLMERGGMSERLVKLVSIFFGRIRGGLAVVSVACCMFFAGISGAATADAAAVGGVVLPMMEKKKYPKDYSAAIIATAGTIGPIIPPSIPMVVYGVTCGVSVGKLFIGGVIPGILIGIGLMVVAYFRACKLGLPTDDIKYSWGEIVQAFKESFLTLLAPLFIVLGIVSGTFTPTETASVAVVYSFILGFFVYKEITLKDIGQLVLSGMLSAASVMLIVAVSALSAWLIAAVQLPTSAIAMFKSLTSNPLTLMIILNIFLLFWGTIMDITPAIMLLAPIFVPLLSNYGIDITYFGVVMIVNLCLGLVTPPVGTVLYVMSGMVKEKPMRVARAALPFMGVMVVIIALMIFVPQTVTWLPSLFFK